MTTPTPIHLIVEINEDDIRPAVERAAQSAVEGWRTHWHANGYFDGQADERAANEVTVHVAAVFARLVSESTEPQDRPHGWALDMLRHLADGTIPDWAATTAKETPDANH